MNIKKSVSTYVLVFGCICTTPNFVAAQEAIDLEVSANIGIMSHYVFRGFYQSDVTPNGGVDLSYAPFYLGGWVAKLDSGDGFEYDVYGGMDFPVGENYHFGFGYTAYRYTDDDANNGFDDDYDEVNLYAGGAFGEIGVEFEYSAGEHDILGGGENDYDFLAATLDYRGLYLTVGEFGIFRDDEADAEPQGGYVELGYGLNFKGVDLTLGAVNSEKELGSPGSDTRVMASAQYTFDF